MNVRCVITGHDAKGKSVFARDEQVRPIVISSMPGLDFTRVWGSDEHPTVPVDGKAAVPANYFPTEDGYRFGFFTLPAETDAAGDLMAIAAEMQEKVPGLLESMEPDHFPMHTTQTVDWDIILSGEVWLELDGGKEVLLKAGDSVVQNGTRHAWHNRSKEPCRFAVCLLGARKR